MVVNINKNSTFVASGATLLTSPTSSSTTDPQSEVNLILIDVPKTRFNSGDTLNVVIDMWAKDDGDDTATYGFAHDPGNKNDTSAGALKIIADASNTTFKVAVPFRNQL